jgi:bifunctional ADP-heptose synthase (sugar kinase/adenylyltransferase)
MENPAVDSGDPIEDHLLLAFASPSHLDAPTSTALVRKFGASSTPASLRELVNSSSADSSSTTTSIQFAAVRPPTSEDRVILVDGPFDSLSVEDVETLRKAASEGTYVVVAVWSFEVCLLTVI